MAQIAINGSLNVGIGGSGANTLATFSALITQVGTNSILNVQNIGTTTEQLTFGDVTTIGYLCVVNLDPTNFVLVSLATPAIAGTSFSKLLPGEGFILPTRQTTVYAIADTAACDCLIGAVEL